MTYNPEPPTDRPVDYGEQRLRTGGRLIRTPASKPARSPPQEKCSQ